MTRILVYISLVCGILALCCDHERPDAIDPVERSSVPDQEMWDFVVRSTNKGTLEAVVKSGHMLHYSTKAVSILDEGVHVDFYDADGNVASKLNAETGEIEERTENVKAMGNVVVESDSGITLYTDELIYDKVKDKIVSTVAVMVTTQDGDTLHGVGFESDAQMNYWEIKEPHDGVAHKGLDLSYDRFKKDRNADADSTALDSVAIDSATVPDSTKSPDMLEDAP